MKNSQKGFVAPLLIVIAVLVIGGSIYYFSQKARTPQVQNTLDNMVLSTPDQTQAQSTSVQTQPKVTSIQVTATLTPSTSPTPILSPTPTPTPTPKPKPTPSPIPVSKKLIEKEFYVDVFANYDVTLNIFWKIGSADFMITDPNGLTITKTNYEEIKKYGVEWIPEPSSLLIRAHNPVSGYWKITATNLTTDFSDFKISTSGIGENNIFFSLIATKISYSCTDKPLIVGSVHGPYSVKGITISGMVLNQKTGVEKSFSLYDDGSSVHGDQYAGDGRYSNYLSGSFDKPGDYRISMTADNMNGKGMTVVPGDSPDFVSSFGSTQVQSQAVPKFTRTATITIGCF